MVNPAISVRAGARVSMRVIHADQDTAHGLVITAPQWGGVLDAGDDHLARLHRVSRPVSRQPDIRISNDPRFEGWHLHFTPDFEFLAESGGALVQETDRSTTATQSGAVPCGSGLHALW